MHNFISKPYISCMCYANVSLSLIKLSKQQHQQQKQQQRGSDTTEEITRLHVLMAEGRSKTEEFASFIISEK